MSRLGRVQRLAAVGKRRRRLFLASLGPFVLSVSLAGLLVFGLADDWAGWRGNETRDPQTVASLYDDPGAPPLTWQERLGIVTRSITLPGSETAGLLAAPEPAQTALYPGVLGVEYVSRCSTVPVSQMERNPDPGAFVTYHTTEEMSGPDAVCRYHATDLGWGRAGYQYYITQAGLIYRLVPDTVKPYAQLTHNAGITIAFQGMASRNVPSEAQTSAVYRLTRAIVTAYPSLGPEDIKGHVDWTNQDQAEVRAGTWPREAALANTHVDPGQNWLPNRFGLTTFVASIRQPGSVPRPSLTPGDQMSGTASYYNVTGNPTASGEPYDGKLLTGATWLVQGQPAYPFQSWLRICWGARCVPVRINDTGAFVPPRIIDLSPRAFGSLSPLSRGVLDVTVTYLGQDGTFDGEARAFYPCARSPGLGAFVYGDMLRAYRSGRPNGNTQYGCPIAEPDSTDGGVTWVQDFTRGRFRWDARQGTGFQPSK